MSIEQDEKRQRLGTAALYCQQQGMTQLERIVQLENELSEALAVLTVIRLQANRHFRKIKHGD